MPGNSEGLPLEPSYEAQRENVEIGKLIGFHDIEKRIPIERLIAPEVTKLVD